MIPRSFNLSFSGSEITVGFGTKGLGIKGVIFFTWLFIIIGISEAAGIVFLS